MSRLLTLIRTLDRYEIARLRKLICSPFFNENEQIIFLFDEIKTIYWRSEEQEIDKLLIWKKINNNSNSNYSPNYNDLKFRRLNSDLLQLCETFLVQQQIELDNRQELHLLRQLSKRNLDKHFDNTELQIRQTINNMQLHDFDYYTRKFQLEETVFQYRNETVRKTKKTNLEALDKSLTISFLIQKLNKYCTVINYKSVLKIDVDIIGTTEVLQLAALPEYAEVPSILAWKSVIDFLNQPDETQFYHHAVDILNKYADKLNAAERNDLYAHIMNYCIRKINNNQPRFYTELFKLYKVLLDKKYILNNEILNYWDYKNIVSVALRLKEYNWTEIFIDEYKKYLTKNWRENAFTYNLAKLRFAQANYQEVIQLLHTVDYQDIFYTFDSKITLLKTYYLLDEYDALHSLLESFRILLLRDKQVPTNTRNLFMNFTRYLKKLSNLNRIDRKSVEKLRISIEKNNEIADKQWLLTQI